MEAAAISAVNSSVAAVVVATVAVAAKRIPKTGNTYIHRDGGDEVDGSTQLPVSVASA